MKEKNLILSFCNKCQQETNHKILHLETIDGSMYGGEFQYFEEYAIVRCEGCGSVSFRKEYSDSENYNPYDPENSISVSLYPEPFRGYGHIDIYCLPYEVRVLYEEICKAVSTESFILAGMGLRSIIEAIASSENVTANSIMEKISALAAKGLISKDDERYLHAIRFLGNDVVHEIYRPTIEQIIIAMQIIENLISSKYVIRKAAAETLDLPIDDYDSFKNLVISLSSKSSSTEFSIDELLESANKRRLFIDKQVFEQFKSKFDEEIRNGAVVSIETSTSPGKYKRVAAKTVFPNQSIIQTLCKLKTDVESIPGFKEMLEEQQAINEAIKPYIEALRPVMEQVSKYTAR